MSRIDAVFQKPEHTALIAYVTVGYPSIEATLKVVPLLAESGCDIIELGIPFSDPLADGVTIQKASFHSLQNGTTPEVCLEVAGELRQRVDIPLVFMTYYNPVFSYGIDKFCKACVNSGVDGLIVPDLPPEEGSVLEKSTREYRLDLIYLLAPTSTEERVGLVGEKSSGFVYLVSVTGITGARDSLPPNLEAFVARVREAISLPLCVGFGISTPEQASRVAGIADGVIVGSRIIQLMEEDGSMKKAADFAAALRRALD
ncbi:tryptophan synthase subunit alpha [Chloroflexota bacterium]